VRIRWVVSASASAPYAAAVLLRGRGLVDSALAAALAEPVEALRSACEAAGVNPALVVDQLTALSIESSAIAEQARIAVRKVAGEPLVARLSGVVHHFAQQAQRLFAARFPDAIQQLELRSLPLREQWEARGPGMLKTLQGYLGAEALPDSADVILVQPVSGGGGTAYATYNLVSFEALLANPSSDLPEVVRLGWLLSQLQLDLPAIQGHLSHHRMLEIGALGLVPAILAAAHEVELTGPTEALLPRALNHWQLDAHRAETLQVWWDTFLIDRPSWSTALAALDPMLREQA
jgi:hypothetical protein